jgi:hypothetical protein
MCTASWLHLSDGYHLFFNRDEKRSRLPAAPPDLLLHNNVRFLAPRDGNAGGTWIAANQRGVTACLLNGANLTGSEAGVGRTKSRGAILLSCMASPSAATLVAHIANLDLTAWPAFTVVALEPGRPAALLEWSGANLTQQTGFAPVMSVTSSSYDTAAVRSARHAEFLHLTGPSTMPPEEALRTFHRSHCPAPGPYSTCMHRDDAETVSFSHITVTRSGVTFEYHPGPPCRQAARLAGASQHLNR